MHRRDDMALRIFCTLLERQLAERDRSVRELFAQGESDAAWRTKNRGLHEFAVPLASEAVKAADLLLSALDRTGVFKNPANAQPIGQLQARYRAALEPLYDIADIERGAPRPGPQHVFDFDDGLRLMVSRDRMQRGNVVIHVSASINQDTDLWREADRRARETRAKGPRQSWFAGIVRERFRELSGDLREMDLIGWSEEKGVPHFFIELDR